MGLVAATGPKNCDELFNLRQQAVVDGVYDIHVGKSIIQTYCEFNQNGNWMVRKQKNKPFMIFERTLNVK